MALTLAVLDNALAKPGPEISKRDPAPKNRARSCLRSYREEFRSSVIMVAVVDVVVVRVAAVHITVQTWRLCCLSIDSNRISKQTYNF